MMHRVICMQHISMITVIHTTGQHTLDKNYLQTPFLPPSYFDRVEISAQGQDVGNWQGWYGLEFNVAQSSFSVIFSANPCHNNPLYDPQCQGYANALFNQQCTTNPLYDPTCPGYATAYLNQQCSANPLYDPAWTMQMHTILNSVNSIHCMQRQTLHNNVIGIRFMMYSVQIINRHILNNSVN